MGFGKLLEAKLIKNDVKQADLADAINIPRSTLSSIINRDVSKVEIETFLKICQFLKCDPEEFYDEYSAQEKSLSAEDKTKKKINAFLDELTDEEIDKLYDYVEYLLWRREKGS